MSLFLELHVLRDAAFDPTVSTRSNPSGSAACLGPFESPTFSSCAGAAPERRPKGFRMGMLGDYDFFALAAAVMLVFLRKGGRKGGNMEKLIVGMGNK